MSGQRVSESLAGLTLESPECQWQIPVPHPHGTEEEDAIGTGASYVYVSLDGVSMSRVSLVTIQSG